MTLLRQRMLEDMQIRHLSPHTQRSYVEHVARFARHFGQSPAVLGPEDIRAYQLYLATEKQLAPASLIVAVAALRFVYTVTLRRGWAVEAVIPAPKVPDRLPVVPEPHRGGPVSRQHARPQASHDPDCLLRRRPAHLGSRAAHPTGHR